MTVRSYPSYKPSGVEWLDDIPAHWNLIRNKLLFETRREIVGDRYSDFTLLSLTLQGIIPRDLENAKGKFPSDFSTYQVVHPDDFVFCLFDVDETPRTVGVASKYGMITGAYTVFACRLATARYLYYLYLSLDDRKALKPLYTGLRKVIPEAQFLRAKSPQPPPDEQAAIVRYLDAVDRAIRRYISAKRRLIALLNEQKQAIIHQAVTQGLDPSASRKPSGIEWLGDVPAHWEVRRIRSCLESVTAGIWGDDPAPDDPNNNIVCVRVADFDMSTLQVSEAQLTVRHIPLEARLQRLLRPGDLLIEKSGGGESEPIGRAVRFSLGSTEAVCSNFISRLRPNRDLLRPDFLLNVLFVLQSTRRNVPSIKQTTGIQNLDERHYFSNSIAVPPPDEQDKILEYIVDRAGALQLAIDSAHREIALIREYRTRLIADVVTGKLDVRHAPLPESLADDAIDEPLDDADVTDATLDADSLLEEEEEEVAL